MPKLLFLCLLFIIIPGCFITIFGLRPVKISLPGIFSTNYPGDVGTR